MRKAMSVLLWIAGPLISAVLGYQYAAAIYNAEISKLKANNAVAMLNQTIVTMAELQAKSQINESLTNELVEAKNSIATLSEQLERSIPDAVEKDGAAFTGLGNNGLCLYKRALGYHCETTD